MPLGYQQEDVSWDLWCNPAGGKEGISEAMPEPSLLGFAGLGRSEAVA